MGLTVVLGLFLVVGVTSLTVGDALIERAPPPTAWAA